MPPKASKAPASKAPAKGKATKTPGTKKKKKKRTETYSTYIYKVLKQVHPDTGISKRAMGFDMGSRMPRQRSHRLKRTHLIGNKRLDLACRHASLRAPPKSNQVAISWMRTNRNAPFLCQPNGAPHSGQEPRLESTAAEQWRQSMSLVMI